MSFELNSLVAHNFEKISLLQAFNSLHKFDLICISESYLDSTFSDNDPSLALNGYKLVRSDHPNNIKRGGVCIYYKQSLSIQFLNITNLSECLICEIVYNNKKCFIISLYRSPSQTPYEFDSFIYKLDGIINQVSNPVNPNMVMLLGDFNAKLSTWKHDDPDTEEGVEIAALTSSYGLTQMISEATHILANSATCIDLLFTNQPNLISKCGVYSSLHPNCHHQIIYATVNYKIYFPPPYERKIYHYNRADTKSIQNCLANIDWDRAFYNLSVNQQVDTFNNYLMNTFSNYIPNEMITVFDKDPPWITQSIRNRIDQKNNLYQKYLRNGKNITDLVSVNEACISLNKMIQDSKNAHFNRLSKKLSNPKTTPKAYWSILKSFYSDKKIPIIPPLVHNNNYVTDFKAKADLFNKYFSTQCSPLNNTSTLPSQLFPPTSNTSLSSIVINGDNVLKLIRSLDVNKSHGFDNISVRMLKLCDTSIIKPLVIIFQNALNDGCFPLIWKKANVTPIHKKGDKTDICN